MTRQLIEGSVRVFIEGPSGHLTTRQFARHVNTRGITGAQASVHRPQLPQFHRFGLRPRYRHGNTIRGHTGARAQVTFNSRFFHQRIDRHVQLFYRQLTTRFTTHLQVFVTANRPVGKLQLLLFVIGGRTTLLIGGLSTRVTTFRWLPNEKHRTAIHERVSLYTFTRHVIHS